MNQYKITIQQSTTSQVFFSLHFDTNQKLKQKFTDLIQFINYIKIPSNPNY